MPAGRRDAAAHGLAARVARAAEEMRKRQRDTTTIVEDGTGVRQLRADVTDAFTALAVEVAQLRQVLMEIGLAAEESLRK